MAAAGAGGRGLDPSTTSSSRVRLATVSDPAVTLTRAWYGPGATVVKGTAKVARRITPVPALIVSPRSARTVATAASAPTGTNVAMTVSGCNCSGERP